MNGYLPTTRIEMQKRGWTQVDFVLVTGDAYIDHPSFGTAIIGRILESKGYKIAVLAQPDWKSTEDFERFGRPRLGFLINAGTVDSMVANYTVNKRKRSDDALSPSGKSGYRPDRAVIVYSNRAKEAFKDIPVIIGGIEASLRRLGHYDYWDNKIRRSILLDSKADILIYGMGERAIVEIADALNDGFDPRDIVWVKGTVVRMKEIDEDTIRLPDFADLKEKYIDSFNLQYENNDHISGRPLAEKYDGDLYIVQNTPQAPLSQQEFDQVYELPYMYNEHPSYKKDGGIPATYETRFSVTGNRGCFGNCSFCALTYHQGRVVTGRSKESILKEVKKITNLEGFKGYIHDIGGPTANFRSNTCNKQKKHGMCMDKDCLYPKPCKSLNTSQHEYLDILRSARKIPKVKKVFIRSGIRYDHVLASDNDDFVRELCEHHVSGTLKVAPEHISEEVLKRMRKSGKDVFEEFKTKYEKANKRLGKKQYLIPYFMSSHPGSTLDDALELAVYLKKTGFVPDQVQDFYPTPGTMSTCMYYTGKDPRTGEDVYVAKTMDEKKRQRALLHFNKPQNKKLIKDTLRKMGKEQYINVLFGR